ncbi:peptidoglycan-binding domain-containing protein [Pygmaiobacter massiliensis]|uniref:peptidoglycan-binding domain-containing protein n=1 Tax=Pygmaiobacter massiliensis TaxID=1917873 RepID=UPI000C7AAD7E|nr:peptidoglycan-binding protein [Pygmaiobacter massiliensis]
MATTVAMPPYYGVVLQNGSSGPDVAMVQTWLNGVQSKYPQLPKFTVDGAYGSGTTAAVKTFQLLTGLTADGKTGGATWDELYAQYASIYGEGEVYCNIVSRAGDQGAVVKSMQQHLGYVRTLYTAIQSLSFDGIYGSGSTASLRQFQPQFGLTADGSYGKQSFGMLKSAASSIEVGNPLRVTTRYPGYVLTVGSSGDNVRFVQSYLSALGGSIPKLTIDGQYGNATKNAVMQFQASKGLKIDGVVGSTTWSALIVAFNATL